MNLMPLVIDTLLNLSHQVNVKLLFTEQDDYFQTSSSKRYAVTSE